MENKIKFLDFLSSDEDCTDESYKKIIEYIDGCNEQEELHWIIKNLQFKMNARGNAREIFIA